MTLGAISFFIALAAALATLALALMRVRLSKAYQLEAEAKDDLLWAKDDLIDAKDDRIENLVEMVGTQARRLDIMEKLACCGCGHPLERHDDPDSADGYGCRDCECQAIHNLIDTIERPRRN